MTTQTRSTAPPTRFREGEARAARIGRTLRRVARVREVDEDLMARIGRAMNERDELGHRLAVAMRMRAGEPGRVDREQFQRALREGIDAVPDAPPALRDLLAEVTAVPEWVDWELIGEGALVMRRLGQNAADVLLQLSLIGGYRFGGPTDLLVATGGLTGDQTRRRLAETQQWTVGLSEPDALLPGGEAWRLTVQVRAMHALVGAAFEPRWDVARWGPPLNQTDQAATLGLFDGVLLLGCRVLGVPFSARESAAVMHLWKWVGHLLGVHPDFLVDDERARQRLNYHLLRAQGRLTEAGPRLARAVVAAQADRVYPRWPDALQSARAAYERERLLSMLTVFLGWRSMRELRLPLRPPWAHACVFLLNQWRYRVRGSGERGRRRLDVWGSRRSREILRSYFRDETPDVGPLRG